MNIISIIAEHALTVRCLPTVDTSLWSYREGEHLKENQTIEIHNGRKFIREIKPVQHPGWWIVTQTNHKLSTVNFSFKRDFLAQTLEEAIQKFLDSKK